MGKQISTGQPLWFQISDKIEKDIDSQIYKAGEFLPGEFELCNIYNVSRITVRGALSRLEYLGKIKRIKGKGTIVNETKINEPLLKIQGFTQEMKERGIVPSTSYAHIERKSVSGYIAEIFGKSNTTFFDVLERVRCINGVPVGYFVTYMDSSLSMGYDDEEYYASLYDIMRDKRAIEIDYVEQSVSADFADIKTREMLGLGTAKVPVLVMKRKAYSKGRLIEYSVCKYNAEKYEYEMELKKDERIR